MQYLNTTETGNTIHLSLLEDMVAREPVSIHGMRGKDMVVMTLDAYKGMEEVRKHVFERAWEDISNEARRNGLTPEKLEELLSDVR